jgi:hypothetical protein
MDARFSKKERDIAPVFGTWGKEGMRSRILRYE